MTFMLSCVCPARVLSKFSTVNTYCFCNEVRKVNTVSSHRQMVSKETGAGRRGSSSYEQFPRERPASLGLALTLRDRGL